jgi:hypothetical protein
VSILRVSLGAVPDLDAPGGNRAVIQIPAFWRQVADLGAAQRECRAFIVEHDLGEGNWSGGMLDLDGAPYGHILFNGRHVPIEKVQQWPGL